MTYTPEAKEFIEELKKKTDEVRSVYVLGSVIPPNQMISLLQCVLTLILMVERAEG